MNAWYDDIVQNFGEYCLESNESESTDGGENNSGNNGNNDDNENNDGNEGGNSSGDECQDIEPHGNTYCKNVDRYGGCTDKENRWYFDKYCLKTCNRCDVEDNAGPSKIYQFYLDFKMCARNWNAQTFIKPCTSILFHRGL